MRPLTVGSTFTGVGGADLGFEWAGFDIKWQCESDAWKQTVLRAHWPSVELFDDICTMQDPDPVDVMIGGFPCQDLSVAGRRKGFTGERSVLAFEFLRIAESLQPRWIVLENVPGLLSSNGGRDFARLIDEVVGCGYGVAWRILDARYFGVPQRRRRVFIVARRADSQHDPRSASRLALRALFESGSGDTSSGWQAWTETPRSVGDGADDGGSVGTHGRVDEGPTGTLTRMYSEQSGQDFGGGQESWRVVCEPDPAGALTKRYAKGVNTTMDDGAIIAHGVSASDDKIAGTLCTNSQGGQRTTDIAGAYVAQTFRVYPEGGNGDAIAFGHTQGIDIQASTKVTPTLRKNGGGGGVAQAVSSMRDDGVMPTLTKPCDSSPMPDGRGQPIVANRMTVRRLTPVECERLMGWPDEWTAPEGVKASDSKRYAACGDGIVAPVAFWIADRIRMIEEEEVS